METIRVNMTPCEDIKTIHASQNDSEAREWGFELHNNGDVIDASEITDQIVFKAYEGGTEQILPENGSVPTTSPIIADIKYPQGLLTDQEFLYRESPTESDGLAKIQTIYGNTLKWNQLINVGADSTVERNGITFTVKSTGEVIANGTATADAVLNVGTTTKVANHKIFIKGCPSGGSLTTYRLKDGYGNQNDFGNGVIDQSTSTNITAQIRIASGYTATDLTFIPQFFDLTMLGIDTLTLDEVKQWFADYFPLPYYQYDVGSLLPFRGEGIKTVGKNLFDINDFVKGALTISDGILSGTAVQFNVALNPINNNGIPVTFWNNDVTISFDVWTDGSASTSGSGLMFVLGMSDGSVENAIVFLNSQTTKTRTTYSFIANQRAKRIKSIGFSYASQGNNVWHIENFQIEFSATETSYEPYASSALSLPISTYFPNGMDGINDARDYKNEISYGKVIGEVDLGTLNWSTYNGTMYADLLDAYLPSSATIVANAICSKYTTSRLDYVISKSQDKAIALDNGRPRVNVYDSAYTDATAFKTAMSGVYLCYELKTPLENFDVVDLGSLEWIESSTNLFRCQPPGMNYVVSPPYENRQQGAVCYKYSPSSVFSISPSMNDKSWLRSGYDFFVKDTSYSDVVAFKQAMSGVYLLYEKENPQGFTTASLVTENAEIPLSNNDGVLIGKCTQQLSAEPGFHDAKIKLSDGDGDVYSNKLQLHVERKPS